MKFFNSKLRKLFKVAYWHFYGHFALQREEKKRQYSELWKHYPVIYGVGSSQSFRGKALLDYIIDPFLDDFTPELARSHANYQQTQAIVEILIEFGFQVDITDWRNMHAPKADGYDIVIGQCNAFTQSCKNSTKRIPKVFLGWGLYAGATQKALATRNQEVLKTRKIQINQKHPTDEGPRFATDIFYMGNNYTKETYRSVSSVPMFQLPNPIVHGVKSTLLDKDYEKARRNFMWMAAYGAVRRCLDILLEIFADYPEFHLWICGGIEHEKIFFNAFKYELLELPNIHYIGWVDVAGETYQEVTRTCGYMLYPSVSDGMPGSVVNSMYAGVVPIVTNEAGMDCGGYGLTISTIDQKTILDLVKYAASSSPKALELEAKSVHEFASKRYSYDAFKKSFASALKTTLKRHQLI